MERDRRDRDRDKYDRERRRSRERYSNSKERDYKRSRSRGRYDSKKPHRSKHKSRNSSQSNSHSQSRTRKRTNNNEPRREKQSKFSQQSGFTVLPSDSIQINMDPNNPQISNFIYNNNTNIVSQVPQNTSSLNTLITTNALVTPNSSKTDRKLYIGNLPRGITPPTLVKLLNSALLTLKNTFAPGDPIVSAWISSDGHYAFVEFRTPEEANHGFALNNIPILGQCLKVGRPKTYSGVMSIIEDNTISNTVAAVLQAGTMNSISVGKKIQFPTKVLCFVKIVNDINIEDEEKYKEICDDIESECARFGKVVSIFLPRKDIDDKEVPGMGNAYVEFATVDDCKNARKRLIGRRFNNHSVRMIYFDEDKFKERDFSDSNAQSESKKEN